MHRTVANPPNCLEQPTCQMPWKIVHRGEVLTPNINCLGFLLTPLFQKVFHAPGGLVLWCWEFSKINWPAESNTVAHMGPGEIKQAEQYIIKALFPFYSLHENLKHFPVIQLMEQHDKRIRIKILSHEIRQVVSWILSKCLRRMDVLVV